MKTQVGLQLARNGLALRLFCGLLAAVGLATAGLASEVVDERLDRRPEGAAAAGFVLFSWQAPGEDGATHALIASGRNPTDGDFAASFGFWPEGEASAAGAVSSEAFAKLRTGQANSLLVQVDAEQLAAVQATLEKFADQAGPADRRTEDCFYRVVPLLGLKGPYRSAFSVGDNYANFGDLARINR